MMGRSKVCARGTCAYFPVRSGLPQIKAYLKGKITAYCNCLYIADFPSDATCITL